VKAIITLAASSALNVLLGMAASFFLARILTTEEYGVYLIILNGMTLSAVVFTFGVFYSAAQLILSAKNRLQVQEVYGALSVMAIGVSALCAAALTIFLALLSWQGKDLNLHLIVLMPLVMATVFGLLFETVLAADSQMPALNQSRVLPKIAFLAWLMLVYSKLIDYKSLAWILAANLTITAICFGIIFKNLRPSYRKLRASVSAVLEKNKTFGLNIYLGTLFSVGGTAISGLAIGAIAKSPSEVAYYYLASSLCAPLAILPNAIATNWYREFSRTNSISLKIVATAVISGVTATLILMVSADQLIQAIWGAEYHGVLNFVFILSFAFSVYGLADIVGRFLLAQGKSTALRNSSLLVGVILIASSLILISELDGIGAAYARALAGLVYLCCMVFCYLTRR
jgi:O-antigen/teichoic acid export membrane protein